MRFANPSLAILSSRSEKEAKLKEFFDAAIAAARNASDEPCVISIVARSLESPVAKSLHAAIATLPAGSVVIRAALMDATLDENAPPSLMDFAASDVRILRDARFGDAHEQALVTGDHGWIGDCMRRDPTKRDAFEIYPPHRSSSCAHIDVSFAKLWAAAEPLQRLTPDAIAPAVIAAEQTAVLATPDHEKHR